MKGQPAQGEDQHKAEDRLGYFPPLLHVVVEGDAHALFAAEHLAGHESVEDKGAGQWEAEVEAKQPPVLHVLVKLHEAGGLLRVQQTDAQLVSSVGDLQHVKG